MALTDENGSGMVMPVAPMYGGGNGGFGNGFGDGSWWILLLFILLGGFGGGWGNNAGNGGGNGLYPWMNQAEITQDGFRDQMLNTNIASVRDGVGDIATQLCTGFAGVNATVNSGFANAEASANARQIANMQTAFGAQTAMSQGFNQLGSKFADCCCEQRLASCQTQNIVQNEGNATRFADANNTRDIIESQTRSTQAILDKLCQLELDGVKQNYENRILTLQNALDNERAASQGLRFAASQTAQNALISQGFANEVDQLYNRLNSCPIPATPVYGRTPIFTCNNQSGCGCGGNF